jgi:three-Cys-motif partner protein
MNEVAYHGREQSLIKHAILKGYLERFARIVGSWSDSITYVDAFAGPWNVKLDELTDSSFAVALNELRAGRATLASRGRSLRVRCLFLEPDPAAFQKLEDFAAGVEDADVQALPRKFEEAIDEIRRFVLKDRPTFQFLFIDPTGWTGFALETIKPLLRVEPGEVLVNFMTSFVRRFQAQGELRSGFEQLFGDWDFDVNLLDLKGHELDDALVREYSRRVKDAGGFKYSSTAIVLHPVKQSTHFHLLYFTRNPKGIEVFKGAEKAAMEKMELIRAEARERSRNPSQTQLGLDFGIERDPAPIRSRHFRDLRNRYLKDAEGAVVDTLKRHRNLLYLDLWAVALSFPLVWEQDLKDWLRDWERAARISVVGLGPKERVPKWDREHRLRWTGT